MSYFANYTYLQFYLLLQHHCLLTSEDCRYRMCNEYCHEHLKFISDGYAIVWLILHRAKKVYFLYVYDSFSLFILPSKIYNFYLKNQIIVSLCSQVQFIAHIVFLGTKHFILKKKLLKEQI